MKRPLLAIVGLVFVTFLLVKASYATNGLVVGLTTSTPTVSVGDTIRLKLVMNNPNVVQINGYEATINWDASKATFVRAVRGNTIMIGPYGSLYVGSPCNASIPGFFRHVLVAAGSPYGPYPGGELISYVLVATAAGTINFDLNDYYYIGSEGCAIQHGTDTVRFTNAGFEVFPDSDSGVFTVTVSSVGGSSGCSPSPCELDKPAGPGTPVRQRPWAQIKGLYR